MQLIHIIKAIPGLAAIACCFNQAHAQTAGSAYMAAGWFHLAPQDSSDVLKITNVGGSPVNIAVLGSSASIGSSDTFGLSTGYFITDNFAVQADAGIPPKFDLRGGGTLASYGKLGEARQWSPALVFKYYFRNADAAFRPFVGIGVSYIWFTNARITNPTFVSQQLHGPTSVDVDSAWAPVFNAGFAYNFNKHIFASFSVSFLPFSTDATLHSVAQTPVGVRNVTSHTRIKLNPLVTFLNVGYRF
ncbi:outer membrane protein [Burkholderia sp. b14]|nr:outer membrane protein [Burkholderia sp. b13]SIT77483.1 outer membrane protein [Burkholderia sp. b14]